MRSQMKTRPGRAHGVSEVELLRQEVEEIRNLVSGVLIALVGKEEFHKYAIEGGVHQPHRKAEAARHHAELNEVLPWSDSAREEVDRFDLVTLVDLVRECRRSEVASWRGMGKAEMAKLDAAIDDAGLEWAPEPGGED